MLQAFRNFMTRRTISAKVRNRFMNSVSSYKTLKDVRKKTEAARKEEKRPHEVLYFHKVDDPYSHLTIHCINKLQSSFDIVLKPILVGAENLEAVHEPSLYNIYCLEDAKRIAPFYGIDFQADAYPAKDLVAKANSILTAVKSEDFGDVATTVSFALWQGNVSALDKLSSAYFSTKSEVKEKLMQGNQIRDTKDYYFGSAFYYEKESMNKYSFIFIINA